MVAHYGIKLNLAKGGAAYLSLSGTWKANIEAPMTFKTEAEAEAEAFGLASDPEYFGRVAVIKLYPGINQWFVE